MVERPPLAIARIWLAFSVPLAATLVVASAAGAFGGAYVNEAPSWAAQGAGQDLANLFLVAPLLVATATFAARGSLRALLIWMGLLLYVAYSYVLYAFFVHFNRMFLIYVATLGFAFYAIVGTLLSIDRASVAATFRAAGQTLPISAVLMGVGLLFAALWLSEIVPAVLEGTAPSSARELGLPVNAVHVLDLAFALPGVVAVGALARRRHPVGLLLAVPSATFLIVMGIAIMAMAWTMRVRGVPGGGLPVPIVITIAVTAYVTYRFLGELSAAKEP